MKINSIIDLVKDLDTSRQTKNLNKLLIRILLHLQVEFSKDEPELFFFDNLPTTWDDSKTLDGAIGEYITMARRKDNVWYVGCLTNNDARKLNVSLDFLEEGKKYELTMFTDGGEKVKTRTHVAIDTKKVTAKTNLKLSLLPRGGVAMIIKELKD